MDYLIIRCMFLFSNILVLFPCVIPVSIILFFVWPEIAYLLFFGWVTCFTSFFVFGAILTVCQPRNGCRTRMPLHSLRFVDP